MKFQLNKPKKRYRSDLLWVVFTITVVVLVVIYGDNLISYISGNNVLKGDY